MAEVRGPRAAHLTGSSLYTSGGTIAIALDPAQSRGVPGTAHGAARPLDSVYTLLNGPRTDVTDVTKFWLNAFAAPRRAASRMPLGGIRA